MRVLKVITGASAGTIRTIDRAIVIGREGADLTLDDPEMSRRHTVVRPTGDGVEVEDLGSTNGTFVNDARIAGVVAVDVGATIRLGLTSFGIENVEDKTVLRATPAPPATDEARAQPVVPDLDATKARAKPVVPDLDLTAPRAKPVVPDLEVTKARAKPVVPDLDLTAPRARPVAPDLEATKARAKPVIPDLEATKARAKPVVPEFDATKARAKPVVPDLDATTARARPAVTPPDPPAARPPAPPAPDPAPPEERRGPKWLGRRRGRHDAAGPELVAAREQIARLEEKVRQQEIELAVLRGDQRPAE